MNPLDYRPFHPPMANLNRPRIVSAEKLTEAELDAAIAARNWPQRRVEPLPPMPEQPEAAHAAIGWDDEPEPTTWRDRLMTLYAAAWLALAALLLGSRRDD